MSLRYKSGIVNVSHGGTTLAHGLSGTPDEYFAAHVGGATAPYFLGVSSTNVVVAAAVGGISAQIVAAVNHTQVR